MLPSHLPPDLNHQPGTVSPGPSAPDSAASSASAARQLSIDGSTVRIDGQVIERLRGIEFRMDVESTPFAHVRLDVLADDVAVRADATVERAEQPSETSAARMLRRQCEAIKAVFLVLRDQSLLPETSDGVGALMLHWLDAPIQAFIRAHAPDLNEASAFALARSTASELKAAGAALETAAAALRASGQAVQARQAHEAGARALKAASSLTTPPEPDPREDPGRGTRA